MVARLYSLKVRVRVAGVRQESFELDVPLQVIHSPEFRTPEGARMQDASAERQRALEASWLGIHSVSYHTTVIGVI
jgi:hypothetical protein